MIYFIQAGDSGRIKIGFTDGDDAAVRLAQLQTGSSDRLCLLGVKPGTMVDEKDLHRRFAAYCVGGEWFEPVQELLDLIQHRDSPRVGDFEVATYSVAIRVLTVGRKKFTMSLLEQLPVGELLFWRGFVDEDGDLVEYLAPTVKNLVCPRVKIWGWVKGERDWFHLANGSHDYEWRWVLFESDGTLYRYKDFPDTICLRHHFKIKMCPQIEKLNEERLQFPGMRDEDQLFIGV